MLEKNLLKIKSKYSNFFIIFKNNKLTVKKDENICSATIENEDLGILVIKFQEFSLKNKKEIKIVVEFFENYAKIKKYKMMLIKQYRSSKVHNKIFGDLNYYLIKEKPFYHFHHRTPPPQGAK